MRIFKGLENIHAVIDRHENEWRREQGEQVEELPENSSVEESVRRRLTKSAAEGSGRFAADRFLSGSSKKKSNEPDVEFIEPIKQEGVQHSWLYNEIKKAVQDAMEGSSKNTKVVAIFVPVIQNDKEFHELPVDESVTVAPVREENQHDDDTMPFEISVDNVENTEAKENNEAEQTEEAPAEIPEEEKEEVSEPVPEELPVPAEESSEPDTEPEIEANEAIEPEPATEIEEQQEEQEPENHDFDLVPEGQEHPDEELAEAFSTMEQKLETAPESEDDIVTELDDTFPETEIHADESDLIAEDSEENAAELEEAPEYQQENEDEDEKNLSGEAMSFDEIPVIKEEEDSQAETEDFIEEVTPEVLPPLDSDNYEDSLNKPEQNLEPEPIEDFDDEEVFEEPIETLEIINESDNEDGTADEEEVIKLN